MDDPARAPGASVRVAIVEDHPGVAAALTEMLGAQPDLAIVGVALDGEHGVRLCRLTRPHVVLMDLRMPRMDGVEATRRIVAEWPETRIVVITSSSDGRVEQALAAGAVAYVLKHEPNEAVVEAVRAAAGMPGSAPRGVPSTQ